MTSRMRTAGSVVLAASLALAQASQQVCVACHTATIGPCDINHHSEPVTGALDANRTRTDRVCMEREQISLEDIKEPTEPAAAESPFDNDVVDEIGMALGITYAADEQLRAGEKEAERDAHRWELDPASSEDYAERSRQRTAGPAGEILHMTHRGHVPHGV